MIGRGDGGQHSASPGSHQGTLRTGFGVFVLLAVLTAVEYAIAKEVGPSLAPLAIIALVKAGLILWFFMHLARAWKMEED